MAGARKTGREQLLVDENEQLRSALESSLEENALLVEDRDRLLQRVSALARDARTARVAAVPVAPSADPEREMRASQTEEELRVAFEELQVVTEELEVASASLHDANAQLEARVEERTRALSATSDALRTSEAAFRTLIEGMPQLAWRSHDGGDWHWSSPQWQQYTGQSAEDSGGKGWLLALHPDDRAPALDAWARATIDRPLEFEGRVYHAGERRYRHFQTRAAPAVAEDGRLLEWLGTSTDVDDMRQLAGRQDILLAELQHRTRNLMGVVQAVVARTLQRSATLADFTAGISDRLEALARTQGLLSRRGAGRVMFDDLLYQELSAHVALDEHGNGEQVATSGPRQVPLPSAMVQTLALGLHELAANAVKYGALASPSGHLAIDWQVATRDDTPCLRIAWNESGVTDIPAHGDLPRGSGYGRELIEQALPYQLGAKTSYAFAADGVHCTIEMPLAID